MSGPPVILASTSRVRAKILLNAGVAFETASPGVDEDAVKAGLLADDVGPRDIADTLAELKAVRVSLKRPGLVIGADQTLDLGGRLIDKVEDLADAKARLLELRGKTHTLHSGVVIARDGAAIWREVKSARLSVRQFSDDFLDQYLAHEGAAILSSVGCYRLESQGVQLFDRIDGDYFTILGLPLTGLLGFLRLHGALVQ